MTTFHSHPLPDALVAFSNPVCRDMLASAKAAGDVDKRHFHD